MKNKNSFAGWTSVSTAPITLKMHSNLTSIRLYSGKNMTITAQTSTVRYVVVTSN